MWEGLRLRLSLFASLLSFLACPTSVEAAGAVLPASDAPDAAFVDMRMAVAFTPTGTIRWSEVTVPAATRAMWLVPVRPGAAVDWAPTPWLDALDGATAPRILPPSTPSACPSTPELPAAWTKPRAKLPASPLAIQTTADELAVHVAERGYRMSLTLAER
ncbi:MAG TPA: hypothetical protein VM580_29325, partial [Labilithrix sp.]|nr:hypothetical protein [Labilithrix sp.]